jgi:hypothetical protein
MGNIVIISCSENSYRYEQVPGTPMGSFLLGPSVAFGPHLVGGRCGGMSNKSMDSTNDLPKGKACASNNFCVTLIRFAIIMEQGARGIVKLRSGALLKKLVDGKWVFLTCTVVE